MTNTANTMTISRLKQRQTEAARDALVATALALIEEGTEPTMRAVAVAAGVAERTIYRYFSSREDLFDGLVPQLRARAHVPLAESAAGLANYARRLFTTFDGNRRLVRVLVTAPWAADRFAASRRVNLEALEAVLEAAYPRAPAARRRSAATTLRVVLSGAGFVYLEDCGFGLEESIAHVQWSIATVLAALGHEEGSA